MQGSPDIENPSDGRYLTHGGSRGGSNSLGRGGVTGRGSASNSSAQLAAVGAGSEIPSLSGEQWSKLLSLLGNDYSSTKSTNLMGKLSSITWIFDTGAALHATGSRACLFDCFEGPRSPVILPDGSSITASVRGKVRLTDQIVLQDVLYVPSLTCNLISVSKLSSSLDCEMMFTPDMCFLQDRNTRTVIGAGERRGGLYLLGDVPGSLVAVLHSARTVDGEVWHKQLGHPSDKVLQSLPLFANSRSIFDHSSCEICHQAK